MKFTIRQNVAFVIANSADPNEMSYTAVSDFGLCCLLVYHLCGTWLNG